LRASSLGRMIQRRPKQPGHTRRKQHTDRKVSGNLTKTGAYKRRAALVMALVLACHLLGGTGIFCANRFPHPSRVSGNERTAPAVTAQAVGNVFSAVANSVHRGGKTAPCNCKKHQCPTIPRSALTSDPAHRFNEDQRQSRTVCGDSVALDATDHRFALGSAPPFIGLVWGTTFSSLTPLASTCTLLI